VETFSGQIEAGKTVYFTNSSSGGQLWALFDTDVSNQKRGFQVRYDISE